MNDFFWKRTASKCKLEKRSGVVTTVWGGGVDKAGEKG